MLLSVSLLPADELLRNWRVLERESGVLLPPLPGESRGEVKEAVLVESGELGLLLLHLLPNNLREIYIERVETNRFQSLHYTAQVSSIVCMHTYMSTTRGQHSPYH